MHRSNYFQRSAFSHVTSLVRRNSQVRVEYSCVGVINNVIALICIFRPHGHIVLLNHELGTWITNTVNYDRSRKHRGFTLFVNS